MVVIIKNNNNNDNDDNDNDNDNDNNNNNNNNNIFNRILPFRVFQKLFTSMNQNIYN